jgi:predicted lipoprotein with Yx(FWY)xxD motif
MQQGHSRTVARPKTGPVLFAAAVLIGALAVLMVASHGGASTMSTQVKVGTTKLGRILVTGQGRTLYMFARDKNGKSTCYGACASFWPPLLTTTTHVSEVGLKASLLATTKRRDGKLQVTYNGHPLYRFIKDTKSGQTNGQGLNASGGLWWVLSPAGTAIKHAPSTGGYGG